MHLSLTAVLPDLSLIPLPFIYVVASVFGAIIGSFLNVLAGRLNRVVDRARYLAGEHRNERGDRAA